MYVQVHVSWIDSGTAVFAFRGTESTKDGLQDLKFVRRNIDYLQRAYPGAKAHTGAQEPKARSMIARYVQCLLNGRNAGGVPHICLHAVQTTFSLLESYLVDPMPRGSWTTR